MSRYRAPSTVRKVYPSGHPFHTTRPRIPIHDEGLLALEIAELFRQESPDFWKSVQDFSKN